jgi:hypothetical protein
MRCFRLPLVLATLAASSSLGCSLFVDLESLSEGRGAGAAGGAGTTGSGGAGAGGSGGEGGVPINEISFTDDELAGEFGEGTFASTAWTGDRVALEPGTSSGEFQSRIFDAGSAQAVWQRLAWTPVAPYGKPLLDGGIKETGYAEGGIDMSGNVLLLHFEGTGSLANGQTTPDASGLGNDAIADVEVGGELLFTEGRFGQGIDDDPDTYLYVDLSDPQKAPHFQFGTEDFTWALWMKSGSNCATNNRVFLGVEDDGFDRVHLWLGCTDPLNNGSCGQGENGGRAGGTFRSRHGAADGGSLCGESQINDDNWHHLAVVKAGHPDALLSLYVDGELEDTNDVTFIEALDFFDGPELAIGAFSNGTYTTSGNFDEVAIWRRALSAGEIRALHRRGAFRLAFQVRSCADAGCTLASMFAGPGQDSAAWFVDPPAASAAGTEMPLGGLAAQFLQYRVMFESDLQDESPGLRAVTVTATP